MPVEQDKDSIQVIPMFEDMKSFKSISGEVEVTIFDNDGGIVSQNRKSNMVMDAARDIIMELLFQALFTGARSVGDLRLDDMRMGTGTATVTGSQTGLQGATIVTKAITAANVVKLADGQYSITTTILPTDGVPVGTVLTEVGIFTVGNAMFVRQLNGAYTYGTGQSVQYVWTLTLT